MPNCPKVRADSQLRIRFVYDNRYTVLKKSYLSKHHVAFFQLDYLKESDNFNIVCSTH
jgi:hypothetical protein